MLIQMLKQNISAWAGMGQIFLKRKYSQPFIVFFLIIKCAELGGSPKYAPSCVPTRAGHLRYFLALKK